MIDQCRVVLPIAQGHRRVASGRLRVTGRLGVRRRMVVRVPPRRVTAQDGLALGSLYSCPVVGSRGRGGLRHRMRA